LNRRRLLSSRRADPGSDIQALCIAAATDPLILSPSGQNPQHFKILVVLTLLWVMFSAVPDTLLDASRNGFSLVYVIVIKDS